MLCEIHQECARDHYQIDKARAIHDEDRMTDRSNFPRVCTKCGLDRQLAAQAEAFQKHGGFTERLYHYRKNNKK